MSENSKKISELAIAANVASTDRVLVLRSPSANGSARTITFKDLCANIVISNTVPVNSSSNGITGTISFDSGYFYVCVANNTWKRSTLTSW
jgi:hypothetical protein